MHPPVDYILFDLDNTLYSARWGLEHKVSLRVNEYIARYLNMSPQDAWALRKERIRVCDYGTTLEWLRAEKSFDDAETERYFAWIHPDNEADELPADPELRALLLSFNTPLGVLTNSPREHALRILDKLEIRDLFSSIFDIRGNGLKGKPRADVYRGVLGKLGVRAANCLFVDDAARNVESYQALGGTGIYYDEENKHPDFPGPRIRKLGQLRAFLSC